MIFQRFNRVMRTAGMKAATLGQPRTQQEAVGADYGYQDLLHSFSTLSHISCNDARSESDVAAPARGLAITTISSPLIFSLR